MMDFVSIILACAVVLVLCLGYLNRKGTTEKDTKGIGWQFIRYSVLCMSLPIIGILALNGKLSTEAAILLSGAMGYAFGKVGEND